MSAMLYPQTNLAKTEQMFIDRADGVYVFDKQGKPYIEGLAGLWSTSLGYGNEELIEAATKQMRSLCYSPLFAGKTHQVGMDLADKLAQMVPMDNPKIFLGNSGSDANDTHLKLLRYYFQVTGRPNKRKVISRQRGYHGVTMAASCLTGLPAFHQHFNLPIDELGIMHVDCPHYYRNGKTGESEQAFTQRLVSNIEALIMKEGPENIAAFIAEPINGAGGVVLPPIGYFDQVQALLQQHEIFFICDEVITGFGRTGYDFGSTMYDLKPDMMSMAKALSSSYLPISAAAISNEIYQVLVEPSNQVGSFGHGYTYSGHPVSAAVALKTLEIYQRDHIFEHAAKVGKHFQTQLSKLEQYSVVGEVRGVGLIAGLEIVSDKQHKTPDPLMAATISEKCLENGLILRQIYGNTLALCPPLIITKAQADEIIDKLTLSIEQSLKTRVASPHHHD